LAWEDAAAGLLFLFFDGYRFEVFSFENLPAIEAFHVIDPISSGEDHSSGMLTNGLHNQYGIILAAPRLLSSPIYVSFPGKWKGKGAGNRASTGGNGQN
jgi:hypothetical protein